MTLVRGPVYVVPPEEPDSASAARPVHDRLNALQSGAERTAAITAVVRDLIVQVTALPVDSIDLDAPLRGFGIDSVMSLELRRRLEQEFKLRLSATLIWNYPTIQEIARFLAGKFDSGPAPAGNAQPVPPPAHDGEVGADLAEDDTIGQLARELAELSARIEDI
jgi:acyl carrier protein